MTLLGRLLGLEEPKAEVHQFSDMLTEYGRNPFSQSEAVRRQAIIDAFGITVPEETELDNFIAESTTQVTDQLNDRLAAIGMMSIEGGSTDQVGINATPAKMTGWTNDGVSIRMTPNSASDQIDINQDGTYKVTFQVSFNGSASSVFRFELRVDGAGGTFAFARKIGAGGDVGSGSIVAAAALIAGQRLEVFVSSPDGGVLITPFEAQLFCERVGFRTMGFSKLSAIAEYGYEVENILRVGELGVYDESQARTRLSL